MSHTIGFICLAVIVVIMFLWWAIRETQEALDGRIVLILRDVPRSSGARLSTMLNVSSGRLYPALARLERDGRIFGEWEDGLPTKAVGGVPRRRLYSLKEPA